MTPRQQALYRYLTLWGDFTHAEATEAITQKATNRSPSPLPDGIPSDAYTARWNTARTGGRRHEL
jgi:hypothetical protein